MSRVYNIAEMSQEDIDILKEDPDKFINMCLEEIYFLEGKIEGYEDLLSLMYKSNLEDEEK